MQAKPTENSKRSRKSVKLLHLPRKKKVSRKSDYRPKSVSKTSVVRDLPPDTMLSMTGFVMYKLSQFMLEQTDQAFQKERMRGRHFCVLHILATDDAQTQQQLCDAMWVDRASMVGVIDRLQSLGFVERQTAPDDRRSHLVSITTRGRVFHSEKKPVLKVIEEKLFGHLTPLEFSDLQLTLVRLMVDLCEKPATGNSTK